MPSLSSGEFLGEAFSVEASNRNRTRDEIATITRGLKSPDMGIVRVPVPLGVFAIVGVVGIGGVE